jgi:hypothetical protein
MLLIGVMLSKAVQLEFYEHPHLNYPSAWKSYPFEVHNTHSYRSRRAAWKSYPFEVHNTHSYRSRRVVVIVWWLDLQQPMQSVPITTDVALSARCTILCERVSLLLAAGRSFSPDTSVYSTNKTDCHDIIEILLKVALKHQAKPKTRHIHILFLCLWSAHIVD